MDYKHCCVIDAEGNYVTVVLAVDDVPQNYTMAEGEQLIDATPPVPRPHAGGNGYIKPRWRDGTWSESSTVEEIAAWEAAHPAPEPAPPTAEEINAAAIAEVRVQLAQADSAVIELYESQLEIQSQSDAAIIELYEMIEGGI